MLNHLQDRNIQQVKAEQELEIFGRSKTREEIKAERKAQHAREVEALREARRLAKWERNKTPTQEQKELLVMGCILAAVVIVLGVLIGLQFAKSKKDALYEPSETNTGHFLDADAMPELSDEGFSVVVNEVYYTVGEYLCVKMKLGNGVGKPMRLESLEVKIYNGDTDNLIAGGYTEDISKKYVVAADDYDVYTLYIRPEHVKIKNDTLEKLTYEITAEGTMTED